MRNKSWVYINTCVYIVYICIHVDCLLPSARWPLLRFALLTQGTGSPHESESADSGCIPETDTDSISSRLTESSHRQWTMGRSTRHYDREWWIRYCCQFSWLLKFPIHFTSGVEWLGWTIVHRFSLDGTDRSAQIGIVTKFKSQRIIDFYIVCIWILN